MPRSGYRIVARAATGRPTPSAERRTPMSRSESFQSRSGNPPRVVSLRGRCYSPGGRLHGTGTALISALTPPARADKRLSLRAVTIAAPRDRIERLVMSHGDPPRLFGEIALERGFVTVGELYEALTVQARAEVTGEAYRFLGEILTELGYMTEHQVLEVLNVLHATETVDGG